jgi:tellurite resistance protein
MQLDTPSIRRLRDRLLESAPGRSKPAQSGSTLSSVQRAALERIDPLAEVLFLTVDADGARDRRECQAIQNAIRLLTDDVLPAPAIDALIDSFGARLAEQGRELRLEELASRFALDKFDAEAAFTLAAAVALSDGVVDEAEQSLIDEMRRYFGISAERAAALLDGAPTAR